ncbi:MAG: helix-turn-helix domain-containing protein [Defluviitaleaceae bacterium]|nr:helix-turn-helix domain-containing protein [Defluviitaleaceae bacterium]MCL2273669.1 helix-turn-helix domain-containing protein [Defluviitaleaceae bacterium]
MNNIKRARIYAGISQKEVAISLGVAQPTVSSWEIGERNPIGKNLLQLSELFNCSADYLLGNESQKDTSRAIRVPVLGRIPAGVPIEAITDIIDYEEVPPSWGNGGQEYFALKLKGDSMSPKYINGDVVIFTVAQNCDSGKDCAVLINGDDATFKKVVKHMHGITLQPLNTTYEPLFFTNEQVENMPVRILGVAKEIRRSL